MSCSSDVVLLLKTLLWYYEYMRVWCGGRSESSHTVEGEERKGGEGRRERKGKVMMSDGWWNSRRKEKKQKKGAVCGEGGIFKPPVIFKPPGSMFRGTKIIRRALFKYTGLQS